MSNNVNIYDFLNQFWMECEREPFSASETALFHFLVYRANRMRWRMPVIGNTAFICSMLSISRQTLCKSRDGLVKRGVISYKKGIGPRNSAEYTLLWLVSPRGVVQGNTCGDTCATPIDLTHELTQDGTCILTQEGTQVLTPYNTTTGNKENYKDYSIEKVCCPSKNLSVSELSNELLNDVPWRNNLIKVLIDDGIVSKTEHSADELDSLMRQFFSIQELSCKTYQSKQDCQKHLLNWIRYRHTSADNDSKNINSNKNINVYATANNYRQDTIKRGFCLEASSKEKNFDASFI